MYTEIVYNDRMRTEKIHNNRMCAEILSRSNGRMHRLIMYKGRGYTGIMKNVRVER